MKVSQLFGQAIKETPKDEENRSAILLIRAGYIDKVGAGLYSYLPLGLRSLAKIQNIIREEMNDIGGQEVFMPALQPASYWKDSGRWDVPVGFKTKSQTGQEYMIGWTHEEIATTMAKKFVKSYKDLPLAIYQFQEKIRDEERPKSGLLRVREFLMKDLYSFHANEKDFQEFYKKAQKAYFKIFKRIGLSEITYYTSASGGEFSEFSNEFQTLSDVGEDTIYICDKCRIAVNKEIIDKVKICPECKNSNLREAKSIETGNIFPLADRYTKAFDFKYLDKDGNQKFPIMGCYGIGLGRLMGTIAEVTCDDSGLAWPEEVAPFKIYLISLGENDKAGELYEKLSQAGIEVLYDDSEDRAGEKFARADLMGIPIRLTVSEKSLAAGGVEYKKRVQKEVEIVPFDQIIEKTNNG